MFCPKSRGVYSVYNAVVGVGASTHDACYDGRFRITFSAKTQNRRKISHFFLVTQVWATGGLFTWILRFSVWMKLGFIDFFFFFSVGGGGGG